MRREVLLSSLKIQKPIIQSPMFGGVTSAEFVASVSNAGGLGVLSASMMLPGQIRQQIRKIRQLTTQPFAVHLNAPVPYEYTDDQFRMVSHCLKPFVDELGLPELSLPDNFVLSFSEQMSVILDEQVPVFYFSNGVPALKWFEACKQSTIVVMGSITTPEEAMVLNQVGADIIVARGVEAGGDRSYFLPGAESSLLSRQALNVELIDAIQVPVVSSGGLVSQNEIQEALYEADGVELGAALMLTHESGLMPALKQHIADLKTDQSVFSNAYTGRSARVVNNRFVAAMSSFKPFLLPQPIQSILLEPMINVANQLGVLGLLPIWAEQGGYRASIESVDCIISALYQPEVSFA